MVESVLQPHGLRGSRPVNKTFSPRWIHFGYIAVFTCSGELCFIEKCWMLKQKKSFFVYVKLL